MIKNNKKIIQCCTIAHLILLICTVNLFSQQINIDRIERMPNMPAPYEMRNWKQVALGYDSLVFNLNLTGEYLPLIWINQNTQNYPEHESFGLHSYVGTHSPFGAEAINILPAVISASLVGIDKSNQNGYNWVLMCEEFFNNRPSEYVYLNNPLAFSGSDWWYDTMPNVFFYQLYDLYPETGDFERQFGLVADRWLEAVVKMGGKTTPWNVPYMNYRAWKLSDMTPLNVGVKQPEAAGAIGWLLYHAYLETGKEKYRIGAEWCMEFLDGWSKNPSYELQLPYGVYVAARMNAELGTEYDIDKMVNWCFDVKDNVRNWGATLGNWGGYDCDGLIGEAKYAGYGFTMNGFEMAGALVPMVRYDERFARAIGKWMLNVANASRLYYSQFLPGEHQDNENWSQQYDPNSYIAYEAMREYALHTGISPYATGDAIRGGWGETNLCLYGSSHVGIFGGIIDTTNVPMILQLDLQKTDYFQDKSYPSFLYFNPYDEDKTVEIELGWENFDLYDAVSNSFLKQNASGIESFPVPANSAVILVLLPPGGDIIYQYEKMVVNGIIADYNSGQSVSNYPPRIKALAATDTLVVFGNQITFYASAEDKNNDDLFYYWIIGQDSVSTSVGELDWVPPDSSCTLSATCIVSDQQNARDSAQVTIHVVEAINHDPNILNIYGEPRRVELGQTANLVCSANDPDEDTLSFQWSADAGNLTSDDSTAIWTAPTLAGFYYIRCKVIDNRGGEDTDSLGIVVQDSSNIETGIPIAYYPFNGNANDESGNDHNGTVQGAVLTPDRFGNPESAYFFNGSFANILVPNHEDLNFRSAISVSLWMKADELFDRESYPISHGSWKNRWKISIIPEKKIRWTIYTTLGIKDLDSEMTVQEDVYYNVTTVYDGSALKIYLNGALNSEVSHSGLLETTSVDLTIGQELPDSDYNFKGVLDDIRIYNYDLSKQEISNIFDEGTSVHQKNDKAVPEEFLLLQNYPNPFNNQTTIRFQIVRQGKVKLTIYDILGKKIRTLVNEEKTAGYHFVNWNGKTDRGISATSGIYFYELKCEGFCQKKKLLLIK